MHQHRKTALLFLAPFLTVFVAFYLSTGHLRHLPEPLYPQTGRASGRPRKCLEAWQTTSGLFKTATS